MTRAREMRKAKGITLAEAAQRLGRSRGHVAYLERSGQWPWGLLQRAMRLYDCRAQDLLPCSGVAPRAERGLNLLPCSGRRPAKQVGEPGDAPGSPVPESRGDRLAVSK